MKLSEKYSDEQVLIAIRLSIPEGLTREEAHLATTTDTREWPDKLKKLLLPKLEAMESGGVRLPPEHLKS